MRILLTGATGYIGSALLETLLARGHEVTALVRASSARAARERLSPIASVERVNVICGDVSSPLWGIDANNIGAHEIVIHGAAVPKLSRGLGAAMRAGNFEPVRQLPRVCAAIGATRAIHISTAFVVPQTGGHLGEEHPGPGHGANEYETYKTAAERWLRAHGPRALEIVRPGIVVPESGASDARFFASPIAAVMDGLRRCRAVAPLCGDPRSRPGFVYLSDFVEIVAKLVDSPSAPRAYWNVVGADNPTLAELADSLSDLADAPRFVLNAARAHPALAAWKPYLGSRRTWDSSGAERLFGGAFPGVPSDAIRELMAPRWANTNRCSRVAV